ncbi:MAG: hypothetical protein SNJ64_05930, partial [Endomicrobiia bacterium]
STGIIAVSTGILSGRIDSVAVSTGVIALSTGTLSNRINAVAVSTGMIAISTGIINTDLQGFKVTIGQSTGTLLSTTILIGEATGQLRADLDEVKVSTGGLVTLDSSQTISGSKTFTSSVTITIENDPALRIGRLSIRDNQISRFSNSSRINFYSGTSSDDSAGIEMHGLNSPNSGDEGRFRILIPQGENSKGFDIMRGGDWQPLVTVSTHGFVGLHGNIRGIGVSVNHDTEFTVVSLSTPQPNTSYAVFITPNWGLNTENQPVSFWVTGKQTDQFTVNYSSAPSTISGKTFDWLIIR